MDALAEFADQMRARGLIVDEGDIVGDGEIHRCKVETARGHIKKNGWFAWHGALNFGVFGRHDDGLGKERWRPEKPPELTPEERRRREDEWKMRTARFRAERERKARRAARIAELLMAVKGKHAEDHPYLKKKGVGAYGLNAVGSVLIVPVRNRNGRCQSAELIYASGRKRYLRGGTITGGYHSIGWLDKNARRPYIFVAEGYATGATVHEATGMPVAIAFNCGNLMAVARTLREKYPPARIVMCADDDFRTKTNPGIAQAREAAKAVDGQVVLPIFDKVKRKEDDTDFNDLAEYIGTRGVHDQIVTCLRTFKTKGNTHQTQ